MRQLIPALLLLTLLLPAAAAAQSPVTRAQFVAALWTCSGAVPYDANGPFSDVNRRKHCEKRPNIWICTPV